VINVFLIYCSHSLLNLALIINELITKWQKLLLTFYSRFLRDCFRLLRKIAGYCWSALSLNRFILTSDLLPVTSGNFRFTSSYYHFSLNRGSNGSQDFINLIAK
jgi:hypothetical protein